MTRNEKVEAAKQIKNERLLELLVNYGEMVAWNTEQKNEYKKADCLETIDIMKQELLSRLA